MGKGPNASGSGNGSGLPRSRALLAVTVLALGAAPARGENWKFTPYVQAQETVTNNVALAPSGQQKTDFVTSIAPGFRIDGQGARLKLSGFAQAQGVIYARTDNQNSIYAQASLSGNLEAVEKFFFVDAAITASQQYLTPFGAQPVGNVNVTGNRYTSTVYRVSPYIQGRLFGDTTYYVRDDNSWSNLSGAPIDLSNVYYNNFVARVANVASRLGWTAEANRSYTKYSNQDRPFILEVARLIPQYRVDPQLVLSGRVGYEKNEFPLTSSSGIVYGAGATWRPTERTNVTGYWEERFFGSSYLFSADHRTPLTAWNINASRNVNTYPQTIGTLPAGGVVAPLLNAIFAARIPDPAARQQAVDQFIQQNALPPVLGAPVPLYTQQVSLQDSQSASFFILGARNSIGFTVFNLKSTAITAGGVALPPQLSFGTDNTQRGVSATWGRTLTADTNLNVIATYRNTVATAPLTGDTDQGFLTAQISTRFSPSTRGWVGARAQNLSSNVTADYSEFAGFIGLSHDF